MRIAVWGVGVSGLATLKYLKKFHPKDEVFAVNAGALDSWKFKADVLELLTEDKCLEESICELDFDQIIIAPGVDKRKGKIKEYIDRGVEVISDIELMFRNLGSDIPVIAITGTNGKTTTTTMMELAFRKSRKKVFCGGNIGTAACEFFFGDYDFVILELSSFQLESITHFRPNMSIILNITESHMERYDKVEDYVNAKKMIFKNQGANDLFIGPARYDELADVKFLPIGIVEDYDFSQSKLIGDHQKQNLFCVEQALKFFKIDEVSEIIQQIINEFSGVKYRLQFEKKINGLTFINDAKSTNIDATISAIETLSSNKLILILGGQLRSDDVDFIEKLFSFEIGVIYVFGQAKDLLEQKLKDKFQTIKLDRLELVIADIKKNYSDGTVLFSPAFPSFDQFKNYIDRGESFSNLV